MRAMLAGRAGPRAAAARSTRSPSRHEVAATSTPKSGGYAAPTAFSTVCCKPDRGAAARAAGDLGGGREREAVPAHREHARGDERRHEQPERRADEQRGHERQRRARERDRPQRGDAVADDVRPASGADPRADAAAAGSTASTRRGRAGVEAAAVVQEEHGEADDAHLRREHERAARGERPDARVAQRRRPRVHDLVVGRSLPQHETADDGRSEAGGAERAERPRDAAGVLDRRQ